jgi:hypothetical protein
MSRFSIILPVRNGGEYVKLCVNSILAQTIQDFNLIVLDNCSTDGTREWLESLVDERILLIPSNISTSLSIEENWARALTVNKNEFITLIGHDDVLDSNYLDTMDKLIAQHPNANLYQAHFRYINAQGGAIRKCQPMAEKIPADMFMSLTLKQQIDIMGTGFMMRSKDYDAVGGIPPYPKLLFADFELWLNLIGDAYMAVATAETFSFRIHNSTTSAAADTTLHSAFDMFTYFIAKVKANSPALAAVINKDLPIFLDKYCQSFAHRLLRTPKSKRSGHTVSAIIRQFRDYGVQLVPQSQYNPLANPSVKLARFIDSNAFTRWLFLLFKKLRPAPVYD